MNTSPDEINQLIRRGYEEFKQGRFSNALPYLLAATKEEPGNLAALDLAKTCYLGLKDFYQAERCLINLISAVPTSPDYYYQLVNIYAQQRRIDEAEVVYERLLAARQGAAVTHYNFAVFLQKFARNSKAIEQYEMALQKNIERPEEVLLNLANVYLALARRQDAIQALERAIAINQQFILAHMNLALLYAEVGNRERTIQLYSRVVELDPNCGQAYERLANAGHFSDHGNDLEEMKKVISSDKADIESKISVGFGLGKVFNDRGQFDAAFSQYQAANELRKKTNKRYGASGHEALVDGIISFCSKEWSAATVEDTESRVPIFIFGMFRSGSTLLEQVLAAHPEVASGGEISFIPRYIKENLSPFPKALAGLNVSQLAKVSESYFASLSWLPDTAKLFTDKRPDNYLYAGLLRKLFPQAKFIHTTRNPLDTALSIYFQNLNPELDYAFDLLDIGHHIIQYQKLMQHWKASFPERIHEVRYDDFVRNQEQNTRALLEFCGLAWDDGCLSFHCGENPVSTASIWQVRKPIYQGSSGRWKHYQKHIAQLKDLFDQHRVEYG